MKFKHGTRRRAAEYEKDWVQRWKDDQTFEKSVAQRPADNAYVFYDGPPFITGVPHHGTLLSSIVKDAVPRYWTMKGRRVERRWGWDCHGLPAENFVEKQMNIMDRRQIVTNSDQSAPLDKDGNPLPIISLEKYINKARESMVANSETWQGVIDRIGRWVDFKGAYRTMDKDFMESVWWAFKQLYEAGKIYEGEKVLMYDTKFATPVSKAEVTMDNDAYQTVTDPSVYVKFKLSDTQKPVGFDECERSYVGALLVDTNGKLIAQQRDDKPGITNPGMVSLFGGTSHEGESPIETLRRELQEELELEVNSNNLLLQTVKHENGTNVACSIYIVTGVDAEKLKLHEGAGFATGTPEELLSRPVTGVTQQAIEAFVEAQNATHILAWTTTPWTLPANLMLAVNPEMTYCEVLVDGEKLIIAEEALERTLQDNKH